VSGSAAASERNQLCGSRSALRRRILELSPGSYRLRFVLTLPDYQDEREVSVQLKGGEEQTLPAPLGRPGFLSIRPHLNTPQGFATAAGKALGKTPLQRLKLPPKTYVVEILSGAAPGETPKVLKSVEVKPETETVLTFDLSGQLPTRVAEKPAEG